MASKEKSPFVRVPDIPLLQINCLFSNASLTGTFLKVVLNNKQSQVHEMKQRTVKTEVDLKETACSESFGDDLSAIMT